MYNKAIKNRATKTDINDLKDYMDNQDKSIHHRIDGVKSDCDNHMSEIRKQLNILIQNSIK